jgi:hypothetical protein
MQEQNEVMPAVIALAGRRVDAADTAPPRFPLSNVPLVRRQLADLLVQERALALVSSAACGADLLALEEAERLGVQRRIVLPFPPERFRDTSVVDRPGDWGPLFDRILAAARAACDLVVLEADAAGDDAAYAAANAAIIAEAESLAEKGKYRLVAALVWEGAARPQGDATGEFQSLAAAAGFAERTVITV